MPAVRVFDFRQAEAKAAASFAARSVRRAARASALQRRRGAVRNSHSDDEAASCEEGDGEALQDSDMPACKIFLG